MQWRSTVFTKQTMLLFIIGVIVIVGIWRFLIGPAAAQQEATNAELISRNQTVAALRSQLAEAESGTSSEVEVSFETAGSIEQVLVPFAGRDNRDFLLRYMPMLPQASGLQAEPLSPGVPVDEGNGLRYVDYSYMFDGTQAQTLAFLSSVEQLPLLATVQNFSSTFSGSEVEDRWSTTVTVRVWWTTFDPIPGYEPAVIVIPEMAPVTPAAPGIGESTESVPGEDVTSTTAGLGISG